ncbi:MAG TPA: ABC transporter substrate-binding protein [Anaerolineales bacterium]
MTARSRLYKIVAILMVAAFLVAGCAPAAPAAPTAPAAPAAPATSAPAAPAAPAATTAPAAPADTAVPAAPAKKTFVFGRYTDAINPDPVFNDANADIWYMQQYYNGLTRFKMDNSVEADLAESWEISDDGLTYTFKLRPDAKFSDGSPITGADWQWSLDRCRDPKNGIWAFTMEAVDTVTATDTEVVFKLKQATPYFLSTTAMFNCVVMPGKQVEAAGGWEKFMLAPVGSGPFIMKEWVKGDHMLLVRNPYYWEKGKPILDEILIKTIPDDNTRILALQKGDVDAINYPPFNRVADLNKDPNLRALTFDGTYTSFLVLNVRNKPLNDAKVRLALSYALDREALIKTVNFGVGTPATSFRPKGSLYFNDTLPGWPYDIAKAKSLLAEAGYPNGFTTTLEIVPGREQAKQIATLAQAMWSQIGVKLEIKQMEAGIYTDSYRKETFVMQVRGWTDDIPDPSQEVSYAMSSKPINFMHTGFSGPDAVKADELAAAGIKENDPAKRQQIYFDIQKIFNDNVFFIPLWYEPYLVATRSSVVNFQQTPLGIYIWRDLDKK